MNYKDFKINQRLRLKIRMNKGSPMTLDHRVVESSRKSYVNKDKCIDEIVRLAELNNKLIIQVDYWKKKY